MATNFLVFGDGTVLEGTAFGYEGDSKGEVVFTTSMDYQDTFTDPANHGKMVIFTYPLIGDYGITAAYDALKAWPNGVIVREYCKQPSEMYHGKDIDTYMKEKQIIGISGIDTRALVIKIRENGTFRGAIVRSKDDIAKTVEWLKECDGNLINKVTRQDIKAVHKGNSIEVGIIDCGVKPFYLCELLKRFDIRVFPACTPADTILKSGVKGVIVSDGPGNPNKSCAVETIKALKGKLPILGIGYGGGVVSVAMGVKVEKMKFGHRGGQSVRHENRVLITAQNRGFAIDAPSAEAAGFIIDQINLNDKSVEGLKHKELPIVMSSYYPEVTEGSSDTSFITDSFEAMMKEAVQ